MMLHDLDDRAGMVSVLLLRPPKNPEIAAFCALLLRKRRGYLLSELLDRLSDTVSDRLK